jgi:hypothetical protein
MRLVDDRGKLFGLVNLIDLLVILLIIGVAISIKVNLSGISKHQKTAQEMYVKVLCRVPNEVAYNKKILRPGDVIMGGNARIEKVLEIRPVKDANEKDTGYSDAVVLIKTNCVILNGEYYCANMAIKINSNIMFSNPLYTILNATILDMDTKANDKA